VLFTADMKDLLRLFDEHEVEYVLVGGFAVNYYGYVWVPGFGFAVNYYGYVWVPGFRNLGSSHVAYKLTDFLRTRVSPFLRFVRIRA
jgi:hypothetical protein